MQGAETMGPGMEMEKKPGLRQKLEGAVLALSIAAVLLVSGAKEVSAAQRVIVPNAETKAVAMATKEQATLKISPEAKVFAEQHGIVIAEEVKDKNGKMVEVKDPDTGEDAILISNFYEEDPETKQMVAKQFYTTGATRIFIETTEEDGDVLVISNIRIDIAEKTAKRSRARLVSTNPMDPNAALVLKSMEVKDMKVRGGSVEAKTQQ